MNSTFSAMSTVLDKQLLQGANNFFQVLRGSQPGQQTSAAKKLAGGVVGGFTNPGMAKWLRSTVDMDANGMVNQLDNSTTAGWFASMIPFSIGYNTAALNTLGEPIQRPWYSATTRRFAEFNTLKPHPIITPLIEAGLSLPDPRKATQFTYTDPKTGTKVTTGLGKHPEVMRRYVELRGIELKRMLNPAQIAALQNAARVNKDNAQNYLTSKIGDTARKIAIAKVEREIRAGTVRL
jgi:hypothetical protein